MWVSCVILKHSAWLVVLGCGILSTVQRLRHDRIRHGIWFCVLLDKFINNTVEGLDNCFLQYQCAQPSQTTAEDKPYNEPTCCAIACHWHRHGIRTHGLGKQVVRYSESTAPEYRCTVEYGTSTSFQYRIRTPLPSTNQY